MDVESDRLAKQIEIFEKHARENFQEIDSQIESIEGVWDGMTHTEFIYLIF